MIRYAEMYATPAVACLPCNVRPLFGEFGLDFDRSAPPVVSNREHIRRAIPSLASPTAKVAPQLGHVLSTEALLVVFEPIPQLRRARLRGKSTTPPSGRLCQGRRHRGPPGRWNGVPPVRIEATTLEAGEGLPVGRIERGRRAKRRQVGPGAGRRCSPGCPSAVALAVRLQDVDVVGEPVQQRAGQHGRIRLAQGRRDRVVHEGTADHFPASRLIRHQKWTPYDSERRPPVAGQYPQTGVAAQVGYPYARCAVYQRVSALRLKLGAYESVDQPRLLNRRRAQKVLSTSDVKFIPRGETPRQEMRGQPGFAIPTWDTERRNVNPRSQRPPDKSFLEGP